MVLLSRTTVRKNTLHDRPTMEHNTLYHNGNDGLFWSLFSKSKSPCTCPSCTGSSCWMRLCVARRRHQKPCAASSCTASHRRSPTNLALKVGHQRPVPLKHSIRLPKPTLLYPIQGTPCLEMSPFASSHSVRCHRHAERLELC